MTGFLKICAVTLAALAAGWGCRGPGGGEGRLPRSPGAPYELIVAAGHDVWESPAGDTLRAMFGGRVPWINREEPLFDVLRALPSGFRGLIARHPNILIVVIGAGESGVKIEYDVWASPQIVISAQSSGADSLAALLGSRRAEILSALEEAHLERDLEAAKGRTRPEVAEAMHRKFGISMDIPAGFALRGEAEDFLWISNEMPASSQGIVIYASPGDAVSVSSDELALRRDSFVRNIPGPSPGSYMATNPDMTEVSRTVIGGREWIVFRGFWDVEGDFMGGPFVSYSTAVGGRVITVDLYVYSPDPSLSQRNHIRQLEHFVRSVRIAAGEK